MLRRDRSSFLASSSAGTLSPETKAIIEAFAHGIEPSIVFIMLGTIFSAMLLPLLIALFYFSTSHSRRRPVFVLNVCALVLGMFLGILTAHISITAIISPFASTNPSEAFAFNVIWQLTPWIAEAILFIRLLAVFPFHAKRKVIALVSFPLILKVARMPILIIYLRGWHHATQGPDDLIEVARRLTFSWDSKVICVAEFVDNMYVSGTFLYQLYTKGHPFAGDFIGRITGGSRASFGSRIRTLFWIAATNFFFPVILNICSIVSLFATHEYLTPSYVSYLNVYTTIICTVLATVWSQSMSHQDDAKVEMPLTHLRFARTSPERQAESLHDLGGFEATSASDKAHLTCFEVAPIMEPHGPTK